MQVYYKEAVGAFVVFDVTRLSTFEAVQMWKQDLDNKVLLPNGKPIPAVLLANKASPSSRGAWHCPGYEFSNRRILEGAKFIDRSLRSPLL